MSNIISRLSGNQRLIIIGISGFVVGVVLTAIFFIANGISTTVMIEQSDQSTGEVSNEQGGTSEGVISSGNDRVTVEDQSAGSITRLTSVTLAASSWVAIHEDVSGQPGNILGALRLDQGTSQGNVTLLRPTQTNQLYYVRIYRDDGDREFDPSLDQILTNATKVPIGDIFRAE